MKSRGLNVVQNTDPCSIVNLKPLSAKTLIKVIVNVVSAVVVVVVALLIVVIPGKL